MCGWMGRGGDGGDGAGAVCVCVCAWVVAVYVFVGGRCMVVTDVLISGLCGGGDGCFGSAGRVVSVMPCRSCRVGHVVSLMSCRVVSLVSHLGR